MADKSFVSMEQAICPACGRTHDTGAILLNKRMRNTMDRNTVTHWEFCPEHQKMLDDGFVLLVAVDKNKSKGTKAADVYRLGPIAGVRREVARKLLPSMGDSPLAWCDLDVVEHLQKLASTAEQAPEGENSNHG